MTMSNKDKLNSEEIKRKQEEKKNKKDADRLERAKKISARKESLRETYDSIEISIKRVASWFSKTVDKFLFSRRYDKVISVAIAGILYMTINFSDTGIVTLDSTYTMKNHNVTLNADTDVYEITGYEKQVDVILTGRSSDVQTARSQANTTVVLDLTGLQTGVHTVKFTPTNFSNRVSVTTKPESATVTIRKKETARFKISHDYLNMNKMDEKYYPGEPVFESTEVLVRASDQTINEIAYVKALIDVEHATESFETEAPLYAYNKNGERMDVDIIPKIVKVEVPITSPSKTVKVTVVPQGLIPDGKSIESVTLDHNSIELFGSPTVLDKTEEIKVNIDATTLDRDMKFYEKIVLPSGIRHSSVSMVNMDIKLAETTSKTLKGLPVAFENNIEGYRTRLDDASQAEVDITLYGAKNILDDIDEENFGRIYFDMAGVVPGETTLALLVDSKHYLVQYELEFNEIKMEVVGE